MTTCFFRLCWPLYRSLDDATQVAIIIAVTERPGVEKGGVMPGPMKRLGNALMASPSLEYVDGYGFIAGGRVSFVNVLGKDGHIAVPLTFGSTRQAGIELDKTFGAASGGRVHGGYRIISRENPVMTSAICAASSGRKAPAGSRAC